MHEKYGKTAAQTALRFLLQNDVVIIPKSVHKDRMQQNFDLFDFTLTAEEMAEILTHAAFYAGWPKAWAAFRMAKEVWEDADK